jgi:hypothetical protein
VVEDWYLDDELPWAASPLTPNSCSLPPTPSMDGPSRTPCVTEPTNYTKLSKKIIRQSRRFSKLKPV